MLTKPARAAATCIDLYSSEVSSPVRAPVGVYQTMEFNITSWLVDRHIEKRDGSEQLAGPIFAKGFDPWFGSPDVIAQEVGQFARKHGLEVSDVIEHLVHGAWFAMGEAVFEGRFDKLRGNDLGYDVENDSPTAEPWEFLRSSERVQAEAKVFNEGWLEAAKGMGMSVEESLKIESEVYGAMDQSMGAVMPDVIREAIARGIVDKPE